MTASWLGHAGQVIMGGYRGVDVPAELLGHIGAGELAGVILFSRNVAGPRQVAEAIERLRRAAPPGPPLLVAVDQEGGRVQRVGAPLTVWPPMRRVGDIDDPALSERVGRAIGDDLALLGFNIDFAPVLDVVQSEQNTVIGDRSFGATTACVTTHGLAVARGLSAAGLLPCGKHFPGHGGPVADSHHTLPVERRTAKALRALDLPPFRAAIAADVPLLMSAHVVYEGLDAAGPGTFSERICTRLLRDELGFGGVLVSDDLEMAAIADHHTPGEAAVAALRAGVDLLLICHDADRQRAAREALIRAAQADERFARRLAEAAGRVARLRAGLPVGRPRVAVDCLFDDGRHAELLRALSVAGG